MLRVARSVKQNFQLMEWIVSECIMRLNFHIHSLRRHHGEGTRDARSAACVLCAFFSVVSSRAVNMEARNQLAQHIVL